MKRIKLSQRKYALVDDADFERVNAFKWTFHKGGQGGEYAVRNERITVEVSPGIFEKRRRWVRLHRFLFDLPPGSLACDTVVDHRDGDGLNCQRENLRVVTRKQNARFAVEKRVKCEPFL